MLYKAIHTLRIARLGIAYTASAADDANSDVLSAVTRVEAERLHATQPRPAGELDHVLVAKSRAHTELERYDERLLRVRLRRRQLPNVRWRQMLHVWVPLDLWHTRSVKTA